LIQLNNYYYNCNKIIIDASNDVNSLHRKNLFLLGEDRYLTTLMLKNFPRRKTVIIHYLLSIYTNKYFILIKLKLDFYYILIN